MMQIHKRTERLQHYLFNSDLISALWEVDINCSVVVIIGSDCVRGV